MEYTIYLYHKQEFSCFRKKSVFDYDYIAISEYIENAKLYLKPTGRCFLGFSSSSGSIELIETICKKHSCYLTLFSYHTFEDGFRIELFEINYNKN